DDQDVRAPPGWLLRLRCLDRDRRPRRRGRRKRCAGEKKIAPGDGTIFGMGFAMVILAVAHDLLLFPIMRRAKGSRRWREPESRIMGAVPVRFTPVRPGSGRVLRPSPGGTSMSDDSGRQTPHPGRSLPAGDWSSAAMSSPVRAGAA